MIIFWDCPGTVSSLQKPIRLLELPCHRFGSLVEWPAFRRIVCHWVPSSPVFLMKNYIDCQAVRIGLDFNFLLGLTLIKDKGHC